MENEKQEEKTASAKEIAEAVAKAINETAENWKPLAEKWIDQSKNSHESEKLAHDTARIQLYFEGGFLALLLIAVSLGVNLLTHEGHFDTAEKIIYLAAGFFGGRGFVVIKQR